MEQEVNREGNWMPRSLNLGLAGEKARMMCSESITLFRAAS